MHTSVNKTANSLFVTSIFSFSVLLVTLFLLLMSGCSDNDTQPEFDPKATFRFDTFGDEALWTDLLRWNEVVTTIDPATALSVGLKVDSDVLPAGCRRHR